MRPEAIIAFFLQETNRNREAVRDLIRIVGDRDGESAAGTVAEYARMCGLDTAPDGPESGKADADRILVVEDEADVLAYVASVLRTSGYMVFEAPDAEKALVVLRAGAGIRLVVTDIGLPGGMDGVALAKTIRSEMPELRILFMSGHAHDTLAAHGIDESEVDVLAKPFLPEDLLAHVGGMLAAGGAKTGCFAC